MNSRRACKGFEVIIFLRTDPTGSKNIQFHKSSAMDSSTIETLTSMEFTRSTPKHLFGIAIPYTRVGGCLNCAFKDHVASNDAYI